MKKIFSIAALSLALATSATLVTPAMYSQAISVNGGAISGTITDNTGAVVSNATVLITSPDTGFKTTVTTTSAGFYQAGPLTPGRYTIAVSAPGFSRLDVSTVVRTGTATSGNYQLNVGGSSETIEVSTGDLQVNTQQAAVQDVLTQEQVQSIPVSGRNFLDTLSVEPGVQLQNGEDFDPTKAGYSAISVNGVSGRTTRILLDGQDVTDEFVGTTMYYIPQGAIGEVQLNRSNQDVSGETTSTGNVLVSSPSGTNRVHGTAFYNFQDARAGFATTGGVSNAQAPWQRNQFGGAVGFPIIKDKLFAFADVERTIQHSSTAAVLSSVFSSIQNQYPAFKTPYKETFSIGRLDYQGPFGGRYFARGVYDNNSITGNFGYGYSLYANRDNTYGLAFGADFGSGRVTHSFRGSYEKFHNMITDQTIGNAGVYNGIPGLFFRYVQANLYSGPNTNAPQATFQSDKQLRYDGSFVKGAHTLRYGASLNRLLAGGFAAFYNATRTSETAATLLAHCNNDNAQAACPGDPIRGYSASQIIVGNGQGYSTEYKEFNQLGGNRSWRYAFYVQDSWKMTPNFTWSVGLRYSVDTNRANQDINTPTCADIDQSYVDLPSGCTSGSVKLYDLFIPGLGKNTDQPYNNLAPQIGFAWSPGAHKTAVRGSFGMFIESNVFNNQSNSRSNLLSSGNFFNYNILTPTSLNFIMPGQGTITSFNGVPFSTLFTQSLSQAAPTILALQNAYKAASVAPGPNDFWVARTLSPSGLYAPFYRQPYSMQWSFGIQQELKKGTILSADYIHNTTLRVSQEIDINRDGAARTFNATAAQNAINRTLAYCHAASVAAAIQPTGCAPTGGTARPATIADFSSRGLDSNGHYIGGYAPSYVGETVATGAAFGGLKPELGPAAFIFPSARSGFDALQVVFRTQKSNPLPGFARANFQVAYQYGRSVTTSAGGSDQFFVTAALPWDNDNPTANVGPASLDRRHQLNFGGSFQIKHGPQIGLLSHFYSAPPSTLSLSTQSGTATLFQSDLNGDGTTGDLAPGTRPGAYMRDLKGKDLANYVSNFNSQYAGRITPAGQALVTAGLMTTAQLTALKGVVQPIAAPPAQAVQNPTLRTFDANISYPISLGRFHEGLSLEPGVAMYNAFNFSNFTRLNSGVLGNVGQAPVGYVNGPNDPTALNRITRTSAFSQGSPRLTEFQLKLKF